MKPVVIFVALMLLAYLQVTAAPFVVVSAAQFDLFVVSLAILMVFQGPRTAMISLPILAVLAGFTTDRSPAIFILALLPLIPLAYLIAEAGPPISRYLQTAGAVLATGAWARILLATTAIAQGASMDWFALIFQLVAPGLVLDLALLSFAYLGCRLLRWEPRSLSPTRERYRV